MSAYRLYDIGPWPLTKLNLNANCFSICVMCHQDAFVAFHPDKTKVKKYLKPLCIGSLAPESSVKSEIVSDMRCLRTKAEEMGLFQPRMGFYAAHLAHILALEVLGWTVLWYLGAGWLPYLLTAAILTTAQVCLR